MIHPLHPVPPHFLREVEHLFAIYQGPGEASRVRGCEDLDAALLIVDQSMARDPGRKREEDVGG